MIGVAKSAIPARSPTAPCRGSNRRAFAHVQARQDRVMPLDGGIMVQLAANCVRDSVFPSGSWNQATWSPPGVVHTPAGS